ncbi:hypothetical protein [Streptomyces cinereoruber]|uniref:hypothetical protein n=1 Tax=Streptomyces cinereoruber TaxID=67260 RepID=UPI00362C1823
MAVPAHTGITPDTLTDLITLLAHNDQLYDRFIGAVQQHATPHPHDGHAPEPLTVEQLADDITATLGHGLSEVAVVEPGACSECGQAPSQWCSGCAACRCAGGHDAGCPYGECPSCAAPADATGTRIPSHRTGCPLI